METRDEDLKIRIFSYVCLALGVAIFIYFCWKAVDCLGKTGIEDLDKTAAYLNLAYGALALICGLIVFFILFGLSCLVRDARQTKTLLEEHFESGAKKSIDQCSKDKALQEPQEKNEE